MSEDDGRKQVLRHQGLGWGDWGKGLKERECHQVPDFLRSRYLEMPGGGPLETCLPTALGQRGPKFGESHVSDLEGARTE